jgi:hypothetical protein
MAKVLGSGGILVKSRDPQALRAGHVMDPLVELWQSSAS